MRHSENPEDLQELKHEAWPGYRSKFNVMFAIGMAYLAYIFVTWKGH